MIELCYVSGASQRYDKDVLIELLTKARKNNLKEQITGLLLYDGAGTFIQTLEGEEASVRRLFEKIKADQMHSRVNVLGIHQIEHRSFCDWQMGFRFINSDYMSLEEINQVEGFSGFLEASSEERIRQVNGGFAMKMLYYFRHVAQSESQAQHHI